MTRTLPPLLEVAWDDKHRCHAWIDGDGPPTLVTRGLRETWPLDERYVSRLRQSGLIAFARMLNIGKNLLIDASLLSALVDCWRSETHTFHFRWGEMTVILQDVSFITGLPLRGRAVVPPPRSPDWKARLNHRFGQPILERSKGVPHVWLRRFMHCPNDATDEVVRCYLIAYLLFIFKWVMFPNTQEDMVYPSYIHLAESIVDVDDEDVPQYNWGSAVLCATYRGLCDASQRRTGTEPVLSGCHTLLQLWPWEHFAGTAPDGLSLLCHQYAAYWRTTCHLVFSHMVEPYNPQRVMRQFELHQEIPPALGRPFARRSHLQTKMGRKSDDWLQTQQPWVDVWQTATDSILQEARPYDEGTYDTYLEWYVRHTRTRLTGAPPARHADSSHAERLDLGLDPHRAARHDDSLWKAQRSRLEASDGASSRTLAPSIFPSERVDPATQQHRRRIVRAVATQRLYADAIVVSEGPYADAVVVTEGPYADVVLVSEGPYADAVLVSEGPYADVVLVSEGPYAGAVVVTEAQRGHSGEHGRATRNRARMLS
uniref:PH01B019A14.15 protein n=1 Tax=Phyllostachys edulis TaxID=38705 RepID=L0P1N2_PHYED|nr:PH01B019A14.15 [Phyllostachys edulis]